MFHILSTAPHIGMLLFAGLLFPVLPQVSIYAVFFGALKQHTGGAHAPTHWMCLLLLAVMTLGRASLGTWPSFISTPVLLPPIHCAATFALITRRVRPPKQSALSSEKPTGSRCRALNANAFQLFAVCICMPFGGELRALFLCGSLGRFPASVTLMLPISISSRDEV